MPEDWATGEGIQDFQSVETSEALYPGGKALSLDASGDLALVGGTDGVAGVYSLSKKSVVATLNGESGAITDCIWVGNKAVIATSTGTVKVFENGSEAASFNSHAGEATALAPHPCGDIFASVGVDKSYVLYDLTSNSVLTQIFTNSGMHSPLYVRSRSFTDFYLGLSCAKFHPDGQFLAIGGADGEIKFYEVKTGANLQNFPAAGPLKTLFFSENGIWLASVVEDSSTISIFDIRKSTEIKVLDTGNRVDSINWDYTGQFLLTGGPNGVTVQQYTRATKQWTEPLRSAVPAVAVSWGKSAQSIVAVNAEGVISTVASKS